MEIEILRYVEDEKNLRIGFVDFKVFHAPDKWEIWRKESVFKKHDQIWINPMNVLIDEKWIPKYERSTDIKGIYKEAAIKLTEQLQETNTPKPQEKPDESYEQFDVPKDSVDW